MPRQRSFGIPLNAVAKPVRNSPCYYEMKRFLPQISAKLVPQTFYLFALGLAVACTESGIDNKPEQNTINYATAPLDLTSPSASAHAMMIAMYRGDSDMIDQIFVDGGTLNRAKADGQVQFDARENWQNWVASLDIGQAHEEIFDLRVEEYGNLATVWAPFVITVNQNIAGCGINQLTMINQGTGNDPKWRIVTVIDTQAPKETCTTFKQTYQP